MRIVVILFAKIRTNVDILKRTDNARGVAAIHWAAQIGNVKYSFTLF